MPFFTEESLDTLRQRIDLIDVLQSHMELKPAGATYKGLCPFHEEKSPSFVVKRGDSHYHCFGCGAHGDAISFLMSHLNMGFTEAIESLAERFGVVLEKTEGDNEPKGPPKQKLREALQEANRFYHFFLLHSDEGRETLEYLFSRGLDLGFIKRYSLGLAPKQPGLFRKWMYEAGHTNAIMDAAGLTVERDGRARDFFYDRITFPIHDAAGHVIGFSARAWREGFRGGKYINTPETPLFKKSRVLFGLHHCRRRIAKEGRAVVVEGQLDALRMIDMGLNFAVASQGTAFGSSHVKELIDRGAQTIYIAFDADNAGREAAVKVGDLFQKEGKAVFVAELPKGEDPDSYLRQYGPEAMAQLLEGSADYLSFAVAYHMQGKNANSPADKSAVIDTLGKQIRAWNDSVMVHESLRRMANLMKVPEDVVGVGVAPRPVMHLQSRAKITSTSVDPDRILEMDLLRWLLLSGEASVFIYSVVRRNISSHHLYNATCRQLYEAIVYRRDRQQPIDLISLGRGIEGGTELIDELSSRKVNAEQARDQVLVTLQRILDREWMRRCERIKMRLTDGTCPESEALRLAKRFGELKRSKPQVAIPPEANDAPLPASPYWRGGLVSEPLPEGEGG